MRHVRRPEEIYWKPRPLVFAGIPPESERPSTFGWVRGELKAPVAGAALDYRNGWTALVFWNSKTYFADEILTFDGMMELIRERGHVA